MPPGFTTFSALGSIAVIGVTDPALLAQVRAGVQAVVSAFDLACSRFRDDSELSALCRTPGRPVPVSELLLDAVAAALRAARLTDGDVDPTLGAALRSLGYDRDYEELAARGPACVRVVEVAGWAAVRLDRAAGTVEVPRGVELDLGATAKALCADRAAAAAHAATGAGVLVSLGGDIALAGAPPQEGWRVRVTDDHRAPPAAPGQWITLHSGGLATSSTRVRRWQTDDGEAHHLLDPVTGRPASGGWRTASVCAASCLDANIASTASIVRGDAAASWLESLRLPARLVTTEGTALHVGGWPADGDDLPSAGPRASVTMGYRKLQP
jgi:thiamine biosynthesis lipoprotein